MSEGASSQTEPDSRVGAVPRPWREVVPPAARARDAVLIGGLAALAFLVGCLAWPLFPGRDAQTYLIYYLEMGRANPVFPALMTFRTPGAPLFFGPALTAGQPMIAEAMLGAAFVIAVLSVYLTGCFWSRRAGLGAALVLLLYPAYNSLYHQISSDGLFAAAFPVWILLLCAAIHAPMTWKFAGLGFFAFVLTMIRPSSAVLLLLAALIVFVQPAPFIKRLRHSGALAVTGGALLFGWAGYNQVRYDDFTISRMAPINVPFFRLFMMDRLVRPENGPASRALANAIALDVLPREPYRSYGVTLDYFLKSGGRYMLSDIAPMSDRVWGWDSDYEMISRASLEAIRAHPLPYAKGVVQSTLETLTDNSYAPVAGWPPEPRTIRCELACAGKGTVLRNGKPVPAPYYPDETISAGHAYWLQSTPDSSISTDWSNLAEPTLRFKSATQEQAFAALSANLASALRNIPPRKPVARLMKVANVLSELLPSMWIWLLFGLAGFIWNVRFGRRLLLALPAMAVAFLFINSLGLPPSAAYRLPFDPIFILFGVTGLAGVRAPPRAVETAHQARGSASAGTPDVQ